MRPGVGVPDPCAAENPVSFLLDAKDVGLERGKVPRGNGATPDNQLVCQIEPGRERQLQGSDRPVPWPNSEDTG